MPSQQDISPQRSLSENPKIDPSCIGWVQVDHALALYVCSTLSELCFFFWLSHHFCYLHVYLILLYMLVGVYLLWCEGCVGFWAYIPCLLPLLGLSVAWAKALIFQLSPCFPFLCLWAFWLLILSYHFVVLAIALPFLLLLVTPWACELMLLSC